MTRKELKRTLAENLKKIKHTHKYNYRAMAAKLNIDRSTYNRNENSVSLPGVLSLYFMGENLNISLDWFIRGKGPMYFTEKKPVETVVKEVEKKQELEGDLKELFESMRQSSQLRYEMLAYYLKLKNKMKDEGQGARED